MTARARVRRRPLQATRRSRAGPGLLAVRNLGLAYGGLQVLFDIDLDVHNGEILAVLGTNGAGKSSLLRAITGLSPITGGSVLLDGTDVSKASAADRVRAGIVMVPGGRAAFPDLTVAENLRLGAYLLRGEPDLVEARTDQVLGYFPALRPRLRDRASSLSGGQRQMLALAKGLLLAPRVLCIDELSLGLAPGVVGDLLDTVRLLQSEHGTTMVIVEQSINVALTLAERAVFMEKGHVRFEGPAKDLLERDDLARAVFLGNR